MAYTIVFTRRAQQAIDRLPPPVAHRIYAAIYALSDNPRPSGCIKLTGQPAWRIRVGDYQVVYDIDDQALVITITNIGHRRDVYR